ncbi:phage baseplate plug family protein [Mesobacillus zeae]|uniref:Cyanophage baseplate Pam3 plug gp18 domain-containing protein n=1 Tax=Mesobacillus zeae TaxID=1917180 RepID=A0A398B5C0_9BACI|nr:hypothetical protein [Mesobacillus zeae]RID85017.1 hypothetical protein D1970_10645 [Mesobacillus zeae]
MLDYIPIDKDSLPEQFEIDLGNESFIFEVNYNQSFDFFTINLYDANQIPIVIGEKLVLNRPLWSNLIDQRLPAPAIVPMDESGKAIRVTLDNFMVTTFLYIDNVANIPDEPSLEGNGYDG